MKRLKNILVLGNFGYANHDLSGQTIKTRVTLEMFQAKYPTEFLDYFDTQTLVSIGSWFKLLNKLFKCNQLIYLPAQNNLKYLFPIFFILSYIFNYRIIYSVIGGWLVPYLKHKPLHRWMLKRIQIILAETTRMKSELIQHYDFKNVDVLYNFRISEFKAEIKEHTDLKLVFMARIDPNKGLDTIFHLCDRINKCQPKPNITIDFFGPFSPNIRSQEFIAEVSKYNFVSYHGHLEPEEIHKTLSDYDILLLPTHYYTEGLPGSLIDAYISGLPTIVSEWMHAKEFVENNSNGYIIPFTNHTEEICKIVFDLYNNRELLNGLKRNAIEHGKQFSLNYAWNKISNYITQ